MTTRRDEIRKPPRPPFEHVKGVCSMCAGPLSGRRRSWCSDACVDLWWVATDSARALDHLVGLHGRECWDCGARIRPGQLSEWETLGFVHLRHRGGPVCAWPPPVHGPPLPRPVELFVDHVRPLWSLDDAERLDLAWWLPFNLQLLCGDCHGRKTADEARIRASIRRGDRTSFHVAAPVHQGSLL